ncbi:DUF305 domain-containing protein [Nonomuraea angiospora]|uniref:Uncharacterized protein (DUF305 family) n=1 Tax=Nonomuraea angiospora TaxID=46172 RepID=A0ABR9MBP5_9ACTN|nr:DUF305 domain-containing protein [Nonomuraea angiospora]MBE1590327.1 uncharacterized protein (DUF305 family) [Nonomuraea angiospora]MDX3107907.1 DUF305 domain-containing protein [Nonomuraea angiospora]
MRAALVVVMGTVVALSGCTSSTPPPAPRADSTAPVLAPGRPGEQARTLAPSEAATAVPSATANAADIKYVQDMVVHHRQALDMSLLAPTRAESAQLKSLASRIKDAQGPEIQYMTTWLREQQQTVPDHHAAHEGMPGMATPAQMEALKAAKGKDFDRMFLELMINHHLGAIKMSEQVLTSGSHIRIEELASDVSVTQAAEIRRMQQMQSAL